MLDSNFIRQLRSPEGFKTGTGMNITLSTLLAVYSLSMVTSLPGLAVSPILAQLQSAFPNASQMEIQMLESLPSLVIIPFILLAGKLSTRYDRRKLVIAGLSIFVFSSLLYLLPFGGIGLMLFNSVLLGVGAGIVIPLSTGMIAYYFAGNRRTEQLGIASGVSNLSLVFATALAGFLAGVEWRMAFLVYSLSILSLVLAFKIPKLQKGTNPKPIQPDQPEQPIIKSYLGGRIKTDIPISLMIFYFMITLAVLAIPLNLSLYMDKHQIGSSALSGTLISIFFMAIMLPGFFIKYLITGAKERNNLIWLGAILLGLVMFLIPSVWSVSIGVVLSGLGYGVMQPLIYDRTAEASTKERETFHLALVMTMNYLTIILYPFVQEFFETIFRTQSVLLPFMMSLAFGLGYWVFDLRRITKKK